MAQNQTSRGPQVLVLGSTYQPTAVSISSGYIGRSPAGNSAQCPLEASTRSAGSADPPGRGGVEVPLLAKDPTLKPKRR